MPRCLCDLSTQPLAGGWAPLLWRYTLCRLIVVAQRYVPTCNMHRRPGRCLFSLLAARSSRPISPGHRSLFAAKVRKQETLRRDRAPSAYQTGPSAPKVLALRQRSSGIRVSKFFWSQRDAQGHVTPRLCLSAIRQWERLPGSMIGLVTTPSVRLDGRPFA